jgi:parallel beta-helix repeat protein
MWHFDYDVTMLAFLYNVNFVVPNLYVLGEPTMKRVMLLAVLALSVAVMANAATTCMYQTVGNTMVLQSDCTTDAPIFIPNGFTHNGAGHKITAMDPAGDHFRGAIIQNSGASASVVNTVIETANLADICESGPHMLAGILFDGASGEISRNTIVSVRKTNSEGKLSSCQEGNAVEVMNLGSLPGRAQVTIEGNQIRNYQKTGILLNGEVNGTVMNNTVIGAGPQSFIGQNGIQIGAGASARVTRNTVTDNSYTGGRTASGGIIVASGPMHASDYSFGVEIEANTLAGNDVGVWLMQMNERREAPVVPTRVRVVNNTISNDAVTNSTYQAAITVHGNGDFIANNRILGRGYDPSTLPGKTLGIDDSRN